MKRTLTLPATLLIPLLLAGCKDGTQPLEPITLEVPGAALASRASAGERAAVERRQFTQTVNYLFASTCLGEAIQGTGTREVQLQIITNPAGGVTIRGIRRYLVTFTGQTSGTVWQVRGVEPFHITTHGEQHNETFAGAFLARQVEGPSAPAFLFIGPYHLTIDAQGEVRVEFDKLRVICPGTS